MSETTITPHQWVSNWFDRLVTVINDSPFSWAKTVLNFILDTEYGADALDNPIFGRLQEDFIALLARQYSQNPEVFTQPLMVFDPDNGTLDIADWFLNLVREIGCYDENDPPIPIGATDTIFSGDPIPTEDLEEETVFGNENPAGSATAETKA